MIVRLRAAAPVVIILLAATITLTVVAQAVISNVTPVPPPVTFEQVTVFVYETLAMVLAAVVTICGSAIGFVLYRDRQSAYALREETKLSTERDRKVREEQFAVIGKAVEAVGAAVKQLAEAFERHDANPFAHGAANATSHKELMDRMEGVETKIEHVETKVDVAVAGAQQVASDMVAFVAFCKRHQCPIGDRNPADSPNTKRENDSKDNYTGQRGTKK
jgi:hypothetical protein